MFSVGMKVVCVNTWPPSGWRDHWDRFWHPYKSPIKGHVYTVSNAYREGGHEHVELAELPTSDDFWCPGFYACGFRPIVSRKTSIEIFQRMLTPKQKELAQ